MCYHLEFFRTKNLGDLKTFMEPQPDVKMANASANASANDAASTRLMALNGLGFARGSAAGGSKFASPGDDDAEPGTSEPRTRQHGLKFWIGRHD